MVHVHPPEPTCRDQCVRLLSIWLMLQKQSRGFGPPDCFLSARLGGRAGPMSHGLKSSSTVVPNSLAKLKAKAKVGSYLLFSMALTVCRETPHLLASSSCERPDSFRLSLITFSITTTVLLLIIQKSHKINDSSHLQLDEGIRRHRMSPCNVLNYI